jgi:hypothetical protein
MSNVERHDYTPSSDLDGSPCAICGDRPDDHYEFAPEKQATVYGDGRDINEDNEEIPEWARPYIRTLKAQVTNLLAVVDEPFQRGVESVVCIRCSEHYAAPLQNRTANGSECGICVGVDRDADIDGLEQAIREYVRGRVNVEGYCMTCDSLVSIGHASWCRIGVLAQVLED